MDLIAGADESTREGFSTRVAKLKKSYAEMSDVYQANKDRNENIPLK